jgi:hypothetical protein
MILVTCGPLEGASVFICRTFPNEQVFVGRCPCSDLYERFGAPKWMLDPMSGALGMMNIVP